MKEALNPDKPSQKHTVLIDCQKPNCTRKRWVKPQDVWQVKLCRWCKEEQNKTKGLARLVVVKANAEKKAEVRQALQTVQKLYVLVIPPIKPGYDGPKVKRIWP